MILFLDFETYYAKDYTLREMTPAEYILDGRFEMILCAVKEDHGEPYIVEGPDFPKWVAQYDWSKITTVTHNALFDNCILAWKYGAIPARMVCTMRLAMALRGHVLPSVSLAAVAKSLNLADKGTEIEAVRGLHLEDIKANGRWKSFCDYALTDVRLSQEIFDALIAELPPSERRIMDQVLRATVVPRFVVDSAMLKQHLEDLAQETVELLSRIKATPAELRSTAKFEQVLADMGIPVHYKPSKTDPTKQIPAFAATDSFMQDLLEHEDPEVQALAAARLNMRSTIEEKRAERIYKISTLKWPSYCRGNMPIPLRYSGAHTHRLSGDWKINMQNLPAGRGGKVSKLRKSLLAPEGQVVVTADLAQIEARINAWFCGQTDLLAQFANDKDPYSILGASIFGYPVNRQDNPIERFIGKTGVLGLGFGCGKDRFYRMVLQDARKLGMKLDTWTPGLADKAVGIYRQRNHQIVKMWSMLDSLLMTSWRGAGSTFQLGPVEIGHGYVKGPNDLKMNYHVLPMSTASTMGHTHAYKYGKTLHGIYGAKFLENIVQFLARIVVMHAGLRIQDRGYRWVLQSHDELVFIVPDYELEKAKKIIYEEMTRPPSWAKDLPLQAEVKHGRSYGDAK